MALGGSGLVRCQFASSEVPGELVGSRSEALEQLVEADCLPEVAVRVVDCPCVCAFRCFEGAVDDAVPVVVIDSAFRAQRPSALALGSWLVGAELLRKRLPPILSANHYVVRINTLILYY